MAIHGQQNGFLQRLEIVRMKDCGDVRAPFPAKLLQALKNPWRVEIEDCKSLEEVFELGELPDEGRSEEKELLSSLTELQLQRLPELKCIWKGPTRHLSLQSLAHLKLDYLDKLTFIFTPSLAQSLRKLERLEIRDCGELKHIIREEDGEREIIPESPRGDVRTPFPAKLLRALKNLKEVTVDSCKSLEEVFELGELPDEGRSEEKELLPSLTKLQLQRLPELKCIWKGPTRHLSLQSLAHLKLDYLDKLTFIFTPSLAQSLPKLERLYISKCGELKHIIREEDGEREIIPESPRGDVRTPFPAKLLRALKNLKEVTVDSCKSLEEVFELGELPDEGRSEEKELLPSLTKLQLQRLPELKCIWKGPTRHLSLQSLAHLKLDYLDKLTFIFTPSLAQSLPKLERLYISKCGQLKHIIREEDGEREIIPESPGQDDQASPINVGKEIVLPNLKELSLEQLSSIVCFSFGWCDYFLFPRLEKLKVHQCPKLTTKFATTSDGSMSAQSKVSEVAEDSSINREWTRNNGWKEVKEEELLLRRRQCFQI
ncbi:hypothetical protein NC652_004275 [Populus alba x Populus x berolinensis]|nr:hypothetical protein NC652_004275 [Populus alba x Populus x berolinensis]